MPVYTDLTLERDIEILGIATRAKSFREPAVVQHRRGTALPLFYLFFPVTGIFLFQPLVTARRHKIVGTPWLYLSRLVLVRFAAIVYSMEA
jgi:hypothetical protein